MAKRDKPAGLRISEPDPSWVPLSRASFVFRARFVDVDYGFGDGSKLEDFESKLLNAGAGEPSDAHLCRTADAAHRTTRHGGPPFRKFGRYPVYATTDLDAWAQRRLTGPMNSTSDEPDNPDEPKYE